MACWKCWAKIRSSEKKEAEDLEERSNFSLLLSVKRAFVMLSGSRAIGTCVTLIYICRDVTSAHILTQIFQFANHGVQLHFLYSISIVFHLWSQSTRVSVHSVHTRVLCQPLIFEKYKKSLFSKLTGSDSNDKSCVPINKWKKGEKMQLLYF